MAQYRIPVLEKFEFQQKILDKDLSTPPVSPVKGDRYIVAASATGAWAGKEKNIVWYDGASWQFDIPTEGWLTWLADENKFYFYNGSSVWAEMASGDMTKAVYDTDADGIVDKAASIDDGAGNTASAANLKDAVTKKHTAGSETVGGDLSGTVEAATVATVGAKTAASIASAVDASHTSGSETLGGDLSGTVGSATVATVGGASATNIAAAVAAKHTQGTDQTLDSGGVNEVSAAQAKEAYTKRGSFDVELGAILFNL